MLMARARREPGRASIFVAALEMSRPAHDPTRTRHPVVPANPAISRPAGGYVACSTAHMIKITRISDPTAPVTRLRVEGRIVLRAADEVAHACSAALAESAPVLLDLGGVAFVDAAGAEALAALEHRMVTIVGCSPFIGALLRSHGQLGDDADSHDDRELTARVRNGDPAALETLVRHEGPRMLATARRLLRDEHEARASVAEAFAATPTVPAGTTLTTWLHRSLATAAGRRLRDRRPAPAVSIDALVPRFDATGHWLDPVLPFTLPDDHDAASSALASALDRLPEPVRTIVVLRDVEQLEATEVAELTGTTAARVRGELHRGRQALRTLLARERAAYEAEAPARVASPT